MSFAEGQLTNINEFWNQDYVNIACTGPQDGDPCPFGFPQAIWAFHDDEGYAMEYLCRQCGEALVQASHAMYGTPL